MSTSSFSRNTSLMAAGTLISRITGFGRTIALTYALGAGAFAGTYLLANTVPTIIYELVVGGVLSATLVPVFARQFAREDDDEAWAAVSAVFTTTLAVITALTLIVLIAAPVIIELYTILNNEPSAADQKHTATYLLRLFAPQIAIYGFISVATGLLHARRKFAPPMFAPICNNLVIIAILLAIPHLISDISLEGMRNNTAGLTFLGLGTTLGVVTMGLVLLPYVRKVSAGRLKLTRNIRHPAVKEMLKLSGWTIGFVIANQISFWVTIVLAGKSEEDVAAFLLAYQFFILPHAVLSVSVMSALQPELAERWAKNSIESFKTSMIRGIRVLMLVLAPTAVLLCLLAQPVIAIVFEHGRTSEASSNTIALIVALMTVGLPGFSAFLFFTRVLQAMQDARVVFWLYVVENGINVATAYPLYLAFGVGGLAISQSLAYCSAAVLAFLAIRRRAGNLGGRTLFGSVVRIAVASTITVFIVLSARILLSDSPNLVVVLVGGSAGIIGFLGLARLIAPTELALILKMSRSNAT